MELNKDLLHFVETASKNLYAGYEKLLGVWPQNSEQLLIFYAFYHFMNWTHPLLWLIPLLHICVQNGFTKTEFLQEFLSLRCTPVKSVKDSVSGLEEHWIRVYDSYPIRCITTTSLLTTLIWTYGTVNWTEKTILIWCIVFIGTFVEDWLLYMSDYNQHTLRFMRNNHIFCLLRECVWCICFPGHIYIPILFRLVSFYVKWTKQQEQVKFDLPKLSSLPLLLLSMILFSFESRPTAILASSFVQFMYLDGGNEALNFLFLCTFLAIANSTMQWTMYIVIPIFVSYSIYPFGKTLFSKLKEKF